MWPVETATRLCGSRANDLEWIGAVPVDEQPADVDGDGRAFAEGRAPHVLNLEALAVAEVDHREADRPELDHLLDGAGSVGGIEARLGADVLRPDGDVELGRSRERNVDVGVDRDVERSRRELSV